MDIRKCIEEYQCSGCSCGSNTDSGCFGAANYGSGCGKHIPGTMMFPSGLLFLGMPKGFNRLGRVVDSREFPLLLFADKETASTWPYDKFNVPVWKYLNEHGHTLVRGLSPRNNMPFIHVHLYNCIKEVDCMEVSQEMLDSMD